MSPRTVDRALRRLVADLATMRSEDVEAIVADLSEAQRARVNALLMEFRGTGSGLPGLAPSAREPATPGPDAIEGLSDWLAVRIRAAVSQADSLAWPQLEAVGFDMTDAGRGALLAAAEKARAAHPARPAASRPAESSGSLAGFLTFLRGGR